MLATQQKKQRAEWAAVDSAVSALEWIVVQTTEGFYPIIPTRTLSRTHAFAQNLQAH